MYPILKKYIETACLEYRGQRMKIDGQTYGVSRAEMVYTFSENGITETLYLNRKASFFFIVELNEKKFILPQSEAMARKWTRARLGAKQSRLVLERLYREDTALSETIPQTFRLPKWLLESLQQRADAVGKNRNTVVKEALIRLVGEPLSTSKDQE